MALFTASLFVSLLLSGFRLFSELLKGHRHPFCGGSVIFCMNLKIALGMIAGGANLRRFGAHHDVSAVPAFPNLHFALFKHFLALHIVQKDSVALFMMLFNSSNQPKTLGKLGKALFLCGLGKFLVHIGPFVVFSLCGRKQILCRIADARKLLEPELGVFLLVFGGFQEKRRNLLIALLATDAK